MQYILFLLIILVPETLNAQTITSLLTMLTGVIGNFIRVGVAVALLVFLFGIVKMIVGTSKGDANSKDEGKKHMLWGVVGLFMIVSVWGVVALLGQLFGVPITNGTRDTPQINLNNLR